MVMQSPPTSDNVVDSFDSARPFHGLVLCCTDIEADQRTEIAQRTADMGGIHRYDLTPDVTHLIVGNYNTAKYRHVARERPDISPMAAGWVEAVRRLWVEAQEIDFAALERRWKLRAFESGGDIPSGAGAPEDERRRLICCLTGFEDNNVRAMIEDKVRASGGEYVADLSRRVTHLIVAKPEGKKYSAACRWGIRCISIEWLHDSVERGMILNEECYDPTLVPEERGKGAWLRKDLRRQAPAGKRARDESAASGELGRRKLRKSASMRMNSQSNNIWGDILNQSAGDLTGHDDDHRESSAPVAPVRTKLDTSTTETYRPAIEPVGQPPNNNWPAPRKAVFSECRFFAHGFPEPKAQVLFGFLTSLGGQLSSSLEDVALSCHAEPPDQRYLIVPQKSQPDSHPQLPEGVHIITEFFIERCIHSKTLFLPKDHVLGQPFPRFPIDGFQHLTICTAGFVNEQLNQIEKAVIQLGAKYAEKLNRQVSLLVCPDLASLRAEKRNLAIYHSIRIVNVKWLWQCIATGCQVPWDKFQFEELVRNEDSLRTQLKQKEEDKKKRTETINRSRSEPLLANPPVTRTTHPAVAPPARARVDMTAFDREVVPVGDRDTSSFQKQNMHESHYTTAPTHPSDFESAFSPAPLSEIAANNLNKTASPTKQPEPERTLKRFPTEGEVGDSEAGEESDATTRTTVKEPQYGSETERRRKGQKARDLERLELSKRLSSLMANDDAGQEGNTQTGPLPPPARRKRQILGRATSNVSVASSTSVDSGPAAIRQLGLAESTTSMLGGSELDQFLEGDKTIDPEPLPPSTQIEYEDLEAKKHRQVVVGRMMGRDKHAGKSGGDDGGERRGQGHGSEKIRLQDIEAGKRDTGPTRRTTRRQGR
ncbi:hypothetical protein F4802DRAFT_561278 [Xylaria palmicola]|nr:hypothetical protein F4802DRAFT_561278 [Xylaria palmicola]